ncbi:hypothetical protein [Glaciimonas sp. PCH181]|uniref:hypothetical protein n=1 Tax=Glaciimonas sp. PCH181 TaxID=2133943 RepID=UPI0011B289B6|nr:hypothetical protein [Glaciimonas sp. PCH181]
MTEEDIRACFFAGSLFGRIRNYFHVLGGRLYLLTFQKISHRYVCRAIPFTIDENGAPIEEPAIDVEPQLRSGWLFDLFDRHAGRVDAPSGVHFGKSSGKHSDKFLRVSGVTLSSTACAVIGYFALGSINNLQPRRVFVDTAPLIAIAFAIEKIACSQGIWELAAPIHSFSSYGGISRLPEASGKDILFVSASTSGGLVAKLGELGFNESRIATLFFLETSPTSKTSGAVVCDLTFGVGKPFGYPPIESFTAGDCELCRRGLFLAELEGDQFLLEKRAVKRLEVKTKTQDGDARQTIELLARTGLLRVKLFGNEPRSSAFTLDANEMLTKVPKIRAQVIRDLRRYIPSPLSYVVLVDISLDTFNAMLKEAEIGPLAACAQVLTSDVLGSAPSVVGGGALVVFGILDDFSKARDINAQLRTVVSKGCVAYISALTIANSAEYLSDLKMFLTYGELGRDTFTYAAARSLMLPLRGHEISPWELEQQLLQRLRQERDSAPEFEARLNSLSAHGQQNAGLFWPGLQGELQIQSDFVYLSSDLNREAISQADIFATIANLLACARVDNRGLSAQVTIGKEPIRWNQSVYGHTQLSPANFEDYNDDVLRAAFLRAASTAELQYSSDEDSSAKIFSIIQALIHGWLQGRGNCLPEFLLSLATNRLTLILAHTAQLKGLLAASNLPKFLITLGAQIH